jgi:hypothetical protein
MVGLTAVFVACALTAVSLTLASQPGSSIRNTALTSSASGPLRRAPDEATPAPRRVASPAAFADPAARTGDSGPNPDCTLIVPARPLTARGLATPFQLTATDPADGPCTEDNYSQSAFVQAAIFNTGTGRITIYNPLVIDQGTTPAVSPVLPVLPRGSVVALWFGYNGIRLTLAGADCTAGLGAEPGHTAGAYCNARAFFAAAGRAVAQVPALAALARPCLAAGSLAATSHEGNGVTTEYLATAAGRLAEDNAASAAALPGASVLVGGGGDGLLDFAVCRAASADGASDAAPAGPRPAVSPSAPAPGPSTQPSRLT